jgi:deoxyribose-phosphate aldolase
VTDPATDPTTDPDELAAVARRALALVDLTSLNPDDDDAVVRALCDRATTPAGRVAAVCIMPAFTALAAERLRGTTIRVATVANFPAGEPDPDGAAREVEAAVAAGADEVDVVAPWRAWVDGDHEVAVALVRACRQAIGDARLKVILEAGELPGPDAVGALAADALRAGAHFVKTSTGKVGVGATPEAARAMLEAIRDAGGAAGFKAAGGIRTTEQAAGYLALADEVLGDGWAMPETFRIGASSLVDDLLRHLAGSAPAMPS